MDPLKHLEEVIQYYSPSFYLGKKWGRYNRFEYSDCNEKYVENIVAGYACSKPFWERVLKRKQIKMECRLLEAACSYWMDPDLLGGLMIACFDKAQERSEFISKVLDVGSSDLGIFENRFIWEVYLVLAVHGLVDPYILKKYHGLRW